jgi:hypothetical protein
MSEIKTLQEWEALPLFDETLNETAEPVSLFGCEYEPAEILTNCDPIAYQTYFADFVDEMAKAGQFYVEGYQS